MSIIILYRIITNRGIPYTGWVYNITFVRYIGTYEKFREVIPTVGHEKLLHFLLLSY